MSDWNEPCRKNSINVSIDLRFTERVVTADKAIDVGIYQTTTDDGQEAPTHFLWTFSGGAAQRKRCLEILVDTDSSEGGTIGEKDFLSAKEMGAQ